MKGKRPTRPTEQITAEAVKALRAGCPLDVVARLILGARHDEMFRWLMIGSGEDKTFIRIPKPYRVFYDEVTKAQAHAEARNAAVLQQGGSRWALEWLKRRHPNAGRPRLTLATSHRRRLRPRSSVRSKSFTLDLTLIRACVSFPKPTSPRRSPTPTSTSTRRGRTAL